MFEVKMSFSNSVLNHKSNSFERSESIEVLLGYIKNTEEYDIAHIGRLLNDSILVDLTKGDIIQLEDCIRIFNEEGNFHKTFGYNFHTSIQNGEIIEELCITIDYIKTTSCLKSE